MTQPLEGIRVLDLATDVAGPFCARTLAELGASVVRVEPLAGDIARRNRVAGDAPADPERAPVHLWVNGGKRGLTLDWRTPAARPLLDRLINNADIVVHSEQPASARECGLLSGQRAAHEALVTVAITPFGLTGPMADAPATDLTITAASGLAGITGEADREPVVLYGHQPQYQGALAGALSALAAIYGRERHGRGEYIDISLLECMSTILEEFVPYYTYQGKSRRRAGNQTFYNGPLSDVYRTSDGRIGIMINTEPQWQALTVALGHPEWHDDPAFATWDSRLANAKALTDGIQAWFAGHTTDGALAELQDLRIPSAPALSIPQLLTDPQLAARDYWVPIDHPSAGTLRYPGDPAKRSPTGTPALVFGRAPLLGEHTAAVLRELESAAPPEPPRMSPIHAPLDGIRVLDITQVWAGPYATELLAELGASVIKVEGRLRPDMVRYSASAPGDDLPEERGGYFHQQNRGKQSLTLDLSLPEAQRLLVRVAATCDVVLNNFAPRVMRNWGADYDSLRKLKPDIITVGMPGFGADGPYGNFVSYGEPLEGAIGLLRLGGYDNDHPERAGIAYLDPTGGISAAIATLGALRYRQVTGEGQAIDFAQRDAGIRLIGEAILAYQLTGALPNTYANRHPEWSPHGIYPCAGEDRWVAIAVRSEAEWAALCRVMAATPDAAFATATGRLARRHDIDALMRCWTASVDDSEAERALLAAGVPAAAVTFEAELFDHPQHVARGFFPEIEHPVTGRRRLALTPLRFTNAPAGTLRRAPLFGEHNHEILRDLLGLDDGEIARLEAEGVVGGRPVMGSVMSV